MRYLLVTLFAASLTLLSPIAATAHDRYTQWSDTYGEAVRALEIATLEQRLHRRVDYPSRQRALRAEIAYAEARITALRRRLDDYGSINRFRTGSALLVSAEWAQLELMREELCLRDLRDRQAVEQRFYRDQKQLNALRVREAQNRLAWHATALPEGTEPTIDIVSHDE